MKWFLLPVVAIGAFLLWVRFAPTDAVRWHAIPDETQAGDLAAGAVRVIAGGAETFMRLDAIIQSNPRTGAIAGTVEDQKVTYVTRSRLFGFPDYTTVEQNGDQITIYGRARYGLSDMGVNAARIDAWLDALE